MFCSRDFDMEEHNAHSSFIARLPVFAITRRGRQAQQAARTAAAELVRLSNHALDDIGLTRFDVQALHNAQITLSQLEARRVERRQDRGSYRRPHYERWVEPQMKVA